MTYSTNRILLRVLKEQVTELVVAELAEVSKRGSD
jgi:hypothetical protein